MSNNTGVLGDGMDRTVHLSIDSLSLSIGGLRILNDVSLNVSRGDLFALIGPNGAGKTSLLNCISGIYNPTQGRLLFNGHDLAKSKSHQVARMGIARTFQLTELFRHMNVLENMLVGRHTKMKRGLLSNGFFWRGTIR